VAPGPVDPGPAPVTQAKPLPRNFLNAPITVEFTDTFENGVVAQADIPGPGWIVDDGIAVVSESGGSLQISLPGGTPGSARLLRKRSHGFNFFVQPLRISLDGIGLPAATSGSADVSAELILSSTSDSGDQAPDALVLSLGNNGRVVLSWKANSPGTRADQILLDQRLPVVPATLSIVIDQTSFALSVWSAGERRHFEGNHGIPADEWGLEGSSAISLGGSATGSADATVRFDAIKVVSLKLFDGFANDRIESSGQQSDFWSARQGGTAVEANGALTLSASGSSPALVSSPERTDYNFFAQQLRFSAELTMKPGAAANGSVARFGLSAGEGGTRASPSAVAISIDESNRIRAGWKTKRPGSQAETTNVLADASLPEPPTSFDLSLSKTQYDLTVYWHGGSRRFTGEHGIQWYNWSATGNSSISLEAEQTSPDSSAENVVDWHDVTVASDQEYFVAPTVLGPFGDGVDLAEPSLDPDYQTLAQWGFVDVTAPPFDADPTGREDSTHGIQRAMEYAREHYLVTYFPPGRYLVSDTLSCAQQLIRRTTLKLLNASEGPCVLLGSRSGSTRPVIVLAPNSPGFADPATPKHVINIWARSYLKTPEDHQPSVSYNQQVLNLDVEIGRGNSGAIGIMLRGAQGSGVQESRIDATHGFAGIDAGSGTGGSQAGVTVIGGRYGLYMLKTLPAPTIAGVTLIGQTESAILYGGNQTLSAVGVRIVVPPGATGPALRVQGRSAQLGQVSLVDSQIEFEAADSTNVAIRTDSAVYLANVYVKNASSIVNIDSTPVLAGRTSGWRLIKEYAVGVRPPPYSTPLGMIQYEAPLYIDGVRQTAAYSMPGADLVEPPADLQSRHLWPEDFPGWESPGAANVKLPPYSARGDGIADDTAAIQRAIDENEIVFIPKGYYRVSQPLLLRSTTKLVGASKTLSSIMSDPDAPAFSDPSNPSPVIRTVDDPNATTVLASIHVRAPVDSQGAYALQWRAGRNSVFRNVNVSRLSAFGYGYAPGKRAPVDSSQPLVVISDSGGGKWYEFHQDEADYMAAAYRHLLVRNTRQRLNFYQFNAEHAKSEANAEVRNSANVYFYGFKSESNYPALWVRDSDQVSVFGYGGNASALPADRTYPETFAQYTPSLFRVERTPNVRLVQLVDEPRVSGEHPVFGTGYDPSTWHMLYEGTTDGTQITTLPRDRPVLYKRGN
jgi:hypothetical protein